MKRIAVTGAFSFSGRYIAQRLLTGGNEVITLTNHPQRMAASDARLATFPLSFDDPGRLRTALSGTQVLVNTYWIRFDHGSTTHGRAVENTRALVQAALDAGVTRIVHVSITNPSPGSQLPYFRGKAANEAIVRESGISHAIIRPTVLFGSGDVLINNMAWLLRHFPFMLIAGNGSYPIQPVFVDDLADMVAQAATLHNDFTWDAVGPDTFRFGEMVQLIGESIGHRRPLLSAPPSVLRLAARLLSAFLRDVLLTKDELDGLMAGLLVSSEPPRCSTSLRDWLAQNCESVGRHYASELKRHYQ